MTDQVSREVILLLEGGRDVERGLWERLRHHSPRAWRLLRPWMTAGRPVAVVRDEEITAILGRIRDASDARHIADVLADHAAGATIRTVGLTGEIHAVQKALGNRARLDPIAD